MRAWTACVDSIYGIYRVTQRGDLMRFLETTRQQIAAVARRWRQQYCRNGVWRDTVNGSSAVVYDKLASLDPKTATPGDVAKAIGNDSWVGHLCMECADYKPRAVEFCESGEHAVICSDCLKLALTLVESAPDADAVDPHANSTGTPTTRDKSEG